MDIKVLHRQGASIRQIARDTGFSRTTIRKVLKDVAPKRYGPRRERPGKLEPFFGRLQELLAARPQAPATVLHSVIAREGYTGHYERVKCFSKPCSLRTVSLLELHFDLLANRSTAVSS
jgi:transposase